MARHTITLGKVDYNRRGRRNCLATLEVSWNGKRFSATGSIWNPRQTDCYSCGQIVEEVCAFFPGDERARRVLALWREWHLNDMQAGSPAQRAWLEANPKPENLAVSHYDYAKAGLAAAGLQPDPNYLHDGKPYSYGSAWLDREIPAEVVAEIEAVMAL